MAWRIVWVSVSGGHDGCDTAASAIVSCPDPAARVSAHWGQSGRASAASAASMAWGWGLTAA